MSKKVYEIPVRKVVDGDLLVLAEDAVEARKIARDYDGHIGDDDVIEEFPGFSDYWEVCTDVVHESTYHEDFECINYEDCEDEEEED